MQALSHISNPSEHTKLVISLRCMHFSTDMTMRSIAARVLRAYASAEPGEFCGLFDYIGVHGDTPTACEGTTTLSKTPGMLRLTQECNPKYYAAAFYDLHYMAVQLVPVEGGHRGELYSSPSGLPADGGRRQLRCDFGDSQRGMAETVRCVWA